MKTLIALLACVLTLALAACRPNPGGAGTVGKISCAAEVVARNWSIAYPHVMTCLTAPIESPMSCLDAIPSAVGVAIEVVACIVRDTGKEAASQQGANPDDVVTMRKADRARAWLASRKLEFE